MLKANFQCHLLTSSSAYGKGRGSQFTLFSLAAWPLSRLPDAAATPVNHILRHLVHRAVFGQLLLPLFLKIVDLCSIEITCPPSASLFSSESSELAYRNLSTLAADSYLTVG